MSNAITNEAAGAGGPELRMNNGLASLFIERFATVASAMAAEGREIRITVWIASRDQAVYGLGCVGFDIRDMPWSAEGFAEEKAFVLRVLESMREGKNPEDLEGAILRFEELVGAFPAGRVRPAAVDPLAAGIRKCPKHGVYLHARGCVICNDE